MMATPIDSSAIVVDAPAEPEPQNETPPTASSEVSHNSATNDIKQISPESSAKKANVVDLTAPNNGTVQLQDVVVTTLFHVSPATLEGFLSPTTNTFKAIFGKKDVQFVIWRKGLEVFVGTYEHHTNMKVFRFEHVAGFLIGYDGTWYLKVTAGNAYCAPKWGDVWAGKFFSEGGVAPMSVEAQEVGMGKRVNELAKAVVGMRYWELKVDVKNT